MRRLRGLEHAAKPRLHIFLATSDLHLKHKLRMTRSEALAQISKMVRFGRAHCENVEFSAEDASRSDIDFLCEVALAAAEAGAHVVNLPDTVGYSTPEEYSEIFRRVRAASGGMSQRGIERSLPQRSGFGCGKFARRDDGGRPADRVHHQRDRRARWKCIARGDRRSAASAPESLRRHYRNRA